MSIEDTEKAAVKHGTLYYFDKDGNPKDGGINVQKSASFLAGVEWEREKLQERLSKYNWDGVAWTLRPEHFVDANKKAEG